MSKNSIQQIDLNSKMDPPPGIEGIQLGPVYYCPDCGKAVYGLTPWDSWNGPAVSQGNPQRGWTEYIYYLDLQTACKRKRHRSRVLRVGDAITPLVLPGDNDPRESYTREEFNRLAREAHARIVAVTGEKTHRNDPAASIVYRLLAGVLAPAQAISEIRTFPLSSAAAKGE